MATLNTFTIVGGLTADPEVRFNTNGKAMATFTIASSERSYDRERNEWVEKSTLACMRAGTTRQQGTPSNTCESHTREIGLSKPKTGCESSPRVSSRPTTRSLPSTGNTT